MNALLALTLSLAVHCQVAEDPSPPGVAPPASDEVAPVPLPVDVEDDVEVEVVTVGAPAASEPVASRDVVDPLRARADGILARAASYQRGDLPPVSPTGLYGRFFVTVRTDEGRVTADAERWFMREPQRMLTVTRPSLGSEVQTEGWDDGLAWFETGGRVVLYDEAPENYQADLERIEEQLRLSELFLDAALLDALIPRLQDPRYAGEAVHRDLDGVSHPVEFVQAFIDDTLWVQPIDAPLLLMPGEAAPELAGPPPRLDLRFAIDADTGVLWGMLVIPESRPEVPELELRFDLHGLTADGLRVPGNIVVRQGRDGSRRSELVKLGVAEDDDGHLVFGVDVDLPAERFAPPGR